MPKMYDFIEKTGVIVPDTADLRQSVENEFREVFGDDLLLTPESPEGVLVTAETEARDGIVRSNALLANQINPNFAGGLFLDAIAALTGLERRPAESTLVKGLLRGVPSTIIPSGMRAATEANDVFVSKKAVVLDASGRAETWFYSEVKDAISCPAGGLVKILDPVLGWETVTNEAPGVLGQPVESDARFRKRRRQTLYLQGVSLSGAIISAVYDVPGVRSVVFRENMTGEPKMVDGKLLAPHSIYICVHGGEDEAVAKAIFTNKSNGCGYNGAVTVPVLDEVSGQRYPVTFDRPEIVQVRARVTVKPLRTGAVDIQLAVREAIVSYAQGELKGFESALESPNENALEAGKGLEGFVTGAGVSPFEIAAAVAFCCPSLFVVNVEVGLLAGGVQGLRVETLPMAIWQKPDIGHGAIEVIGA